MPNLKLTIDSKWVTVLRNLDEQLIADGKYPFLVNSHRVPYSDEEIASLEAGWR